MLIEKIRTLSQKYASEFIEVRHHLHANPELSYQEFETSKFIQKKLNELGIPFEIKATTGVVGLIKGRNPGKKTIALRADMDALPIKEENNIDYKSKRDGIMHACGHDVHTTCLLGASKILNDLKDEWEGTIKLIFQPGEEKNPGGASIMIKEGVLEDPKPQAIFGLHVNPQLETGKLSFRSGKVMASADELYFTIKGKGGHAASPQTTIDPILIASHLVISLQQVISRNRNPFDPSVLSITSINGGTTTNVIPDEVYLEGTFRTFDETWRTAAHEKMKTLAENIAKGMGGSCDFRIERGYPVLKNDATLTARMKSCAENYMGKENVTDLDMWMAAEDFAYFSQEAPACFYRLGVRNEKKGIISPVHTSTFNIDEDALVTGMGLMAWLAVEELNA
jgi:hippurate hydrolase